MTEAIWERTATVLLLIGTVAGCVYTSWYAFKKEKRNAIVAFVCASLMLVGFVLITVAHKEQGKAYTCTITAYSSNGLINDQYSGMLTIKEEKQGYVLFEDEEENEHSIVTANGTIIIEKQLESHSLSGQDYTVITLKGDNGIIIKQYSGYHDIKENKPGYISFEDINGQSTTISYGGTITIDVE